jgi:hypothetical protein
MNCIVPSCTRKPSDKTGRGLCAACYMRYWRLGILESFPRRRWGKGKPPTGPKPAKAPQPKKDRRAYWRAYYQRRKDELKAARCGIDL